MIDDKPVAYLLMRTDLTSMGLGKSRAQAMHAGNQMTYELMVKPLFDHQLVDQDVMIWHQEGQGFGTAISLGSDNQVDKATLEYVVRTAKNNGIRAELVIDKTYPYLIDSETLARINPEIHTREPVAYSPNRWLCFARETTGAWIFGKRSVVRPLVAQFDLTPNT